MSIIVEDGSGISGAESYGSVAGADAYWTARPHNALSAVWLVKDTASKEGALREASDYLDASFCQYYRGVRAGRVQGREWPRTGANDNAGYPLPGLPSELVAASYELAARAVTATLAEDLDRGGKVKSEAVDGAISITYMDGAPVQKTYGLIIEMLASILNGTQPGAAAQWNWG